jgi:hypothetical protein
MFQNKILIHLWHLISRQLLDNGHDHTFLISAVRRLKIEHDKDKKIEAYAKKLGRSSKISELAGHGLA